MISGLEDQGQTNVITTILTLDACYQGHFTEAMLWRDVSKAYFSFLDLTITSKDRSSEQQSNGDGIRPIVSTGKWGCGVFRGSAAHKMMQQSVAAAMAGVDLEFSSFGSHEGCDEVIDALYETKPSVSKVISLLQCCKHRGTFVKDALSFLQEESCSKQERGIQANFDAFSIV